MAKAIGIFANQEQVIAAVQGLENAGFRNEEIKVIASANESSSRIEAETDAHVDEIYDLVDTREADGAEGLANGIPGLAAGAGMTGGGNATGYGIYNGFGLPAAIIAFRDTAGGVDGALGALGLDERAAAACKRALQEGRIAIVADRESEQVGAGEGPELGGLADAESVFRGCGAEQIL